MISRLTSWLIVGAALASACSSSPVTSAPDGGAGGTTPDAGGTGGGDAGSAYPAPHPAMPQVVSQKGPVMASPKVVEITFQGDALQADLDTFVTQLAAATSYWSGATAEYGVGALTASAPQHLAETPAATLTDAEVQQWLTTKINGGGGFPQPDADTLYLVFYPATTTVTLDGG